MEKVVGMVGGVIVGEGTTGKEAIDLYFRLRPDIVIMDVSMPDMEGVEALSKIMEGDSSAKVVIISTLGYEELVKKALDLGARHFITKPYQPEKAAEIIRFVLYET